MADLYELFFELFPHPLDLIKTDISPALSDLKTMLGGKKFEWNVEQNRSDWHLFYNKRQIVVPQE